LYCNNTDSEEQGKMDRHKRSTYGQIENEEGFFYNQERVDILQEYIWEGREERWSCYMQERMDTDTREVLTGRHRRQEKALLENNSCSNVSG